MGLLKVVINSNDTAADIAAKIRPTKDDAQAISRIASYIEGLQTKHGINCQIETGGVRSSSTLTLSSCVATDTAVINLVTLTADTDFAVGASDEQSAINLANAINETATINIVAVATVAGAVVTVKALNQGTLGDNITLTATGGISAGAATLGSGAAGTATGIKIGAQA